MADPNKKYEENKPGPFYVDESCIACGVCVAEAPEIFDFTEDQDHAYVTRQPETTEEENDSREALEACPVDAIGDNG